MTSFINKAMKALATAIVISVLAISSQAAEVLHWAKGPVKVFSINQEVEALDFKGALRSNLDPKLPVYTLRFENKLIGWFGITETIYESLPDEEAALVNRALLKDDPQVEIKYSQSRNAPVSKVSILPLRVNPITQKIERLLSFKYELIEAEANSNASRSEKKAWKASSVLSQGEWVKIGVTEEGAYRVGHSSTLSDLPRKRGCGCLHQGYCGSGC